jgi:SAM-dependent methyltransferase
MTSEKQRMRADRSIYEKPMRLLPRMMQNLANRSLLRSYPNYQPIIRNGEVVEGSDRTCWDRWDLIKRQIAEDRVNSFLDLGCAEGFYVIRAAREQGCFSLGIDADKRRLSIAQNQLIPETITPAGFVLGILDMDLLDRLPKFDMVVLMSVMHHMMAEHGQPYCEAFLSKLKHLVVKDLIFEMGQSNETVKAWAAQLPDMGDHPHTWIQDFLLRSGFTDVKKIGESPSYDGSQKRAIFRARP